MLTVMKGGAAATNRPADSTAYQVGMPQGAEIDVNLVVFWLFARHGEASRSR